MKLTCASLSDLVPAAKQIIEAFPASRVFALYGSMGAGKTTFIKAACAALGVSDIVQSPSFSILNEYKTTLGNSIYHFDFYRIRKIEEVYDIGYEDYLYSGNYCFIEWPEFIEELMPEGTVGIRISGDPQRVIETISC